MQDILKQAVMEAVQENPELLAQFPELQTDKDIIEASLQHKQCFRHLNDTHKNDRALIKQYAQIQSRSNWKSIELHIGDDAAQDIDLAMDLIETYGMRKISGWTPAIQKAHANKDFMYFLIDSGLARHIDYDGLSDELKKDSHIYISMIKQFQGECSWDIENTLKTAHTKLRSNPSFAYECLTTSDNKANVIDCFIGEAKKIMFGDKKRTWKDDLDEATKKLSSYSLKKILSKDLNEKPATTTKRNKI
ncbi:hypothetical protein K6L09_21090 [Burkholderia cepacia]